MKHPELVKRFGAGEPTAVLGDHRPDAFGAYFDGSWEAALVYLRGVIEGVIEFWRERGEGYHDSLNELAPMTEAVGAWFDGDRSLEASRAAKAWAKSTWAWAELIEGRFDEPEGRAMRHLVLALGDLVAACTPPEWVGVLPKTPVRHRMGCLEQSRFQAFEAVTGVVYTRDPQAAELNEDEDFAARVEAACAEFGACGARAIVAWGERED